MSTIFQNTITSPLSLCLFTIYFGDSPRKFGCLAYVHIHKNQRTKLDPCVVRCIFLGYATHKKEYHCYHPTTKRTYVTMDVTFVES